MLYTKGTVNMANIKDAVYLIDDDSSAVGKSPHKLGMIK